MARCDYCGTSILFGGVKQDDLRFCNESCRQQGVLLAVADQIPDYVISEQIADLHQGACPKCGGPGPVDIHTSYVVFSILVVTSWRSRPHVCCRSCGIKAQLSGTLLSGAFGWWGFPWGIIFTPVQIFRNVVGMLSAPDPAVPSAQLERIVTLRLAQHFLETSREEQTSD